MGLSIKDQVKLFQQPDSLAGRAAYTISIMRDAGSTDVEIVAALKALCTADVDAEIEEIKQWRQ
jgi:hypothetical protein